MSKPLGEPWKRVSLLKAQEFMQSREGLSRGAGRPPLPLVQRRQASRRAAERAVDTAAEDPSPAPMGSVGRCTLMTSPGRGA